jgi:branched-chain amino acid transport system permease protein
MIDLGTTLLIILYGVTLGGIYALISSGFTLIFGVSRILNFAHGAFFMLGAYLSIIFLRSLHIDPLSSAIIGIFIVGIVAAVGYKLLISPVLENKTMTIIITLALALIIEQLILLSFGEFGISYPSLISGVVSIGGIAIQIQRIVILIISMLTLTLLWMFISKTRLGKEITAASQDPEAAILMGFNIERLFILTMFISAVLAGLSGVLWSQVYAANPFQILNALIYAFSIVILGGLGSVKGSIVASFIIGFIYTGVTTIYGAHMADLVALIIIIIILIIRPTGLFGVEE